MKRAKALLSFDIEEFDLPEEYHAEIGGDEKNAIPVSGTAAILDVLDSLAASGISVRATFFVTGVFARANPALLRKMEAGGHEIASHGLSHSFFSPSHLAESKALLEDIRGKKVSGFRMARLAEVPKEKILEAGYVYESSLNPVWLPGRYSNFTAPLLPFREKCGLLQFPVSAVPGFRIPLFWLAFKNYPLPLYIALARFSMRALGYYNMYSHPWEYDGRSARPLWKIPGFVTRHAGGAMARRLSKLVSALAENADFITFEEYITAMNDKEKQ